jgi:hypothetical protein
MRETLRRKVKKVKRKRGGIVAPSFRIYLTTDSTGATPYPFVPFSARQSGGQVQLVVDNHVKAHAREPRVSEKDVQRRLALA